MAWSVSGATVQIWFYEATDALADAIASSVYDGDGTAVVFTPVE
ncbi:hypothetical protein [Desulfatibacillum aliphaticivorans]|nr:hypothetical protein [Desulfatibacillum aliphaticivorans]